jgi:hypothetical protein
MKYLLRLLSLLLSLSLILAPMVPVQAAMVGNDQLLAATPANVDRNLLRETLQRDSVKQQLATLGITQEQALQRVDRMTDQEVAQLNQKLADLPAGGDVLGVIVLFLVIFIITDIIGATDIFPFIHPVR